MLKMVPLELIKDNPYRDKKRNPVEKARVEQLVESIGTTGFWRGIYGREVGKYTEIAFGHTRVDAGRAAGLTEIPVEIEELTDSDMLMRMTRENLRGELLVSLEAVSAAVRAFGAGAVQFEEVSKDTRKDALRYAPSFVPGKVPDTPGVSRTYNADTLARFLGGVYVKSARGGIAQNSVLAALGILEMEERKVAGFSERTMRAATDDGVQYLGAKKIIQIVSDVKQREIKIEERRIKSAEEIAKINAESLRIQAEQKAKEKKVDDERKALVKKLAEAKREEDAKQVKKIKEKIEEKEKYAVEDQLAYEVKSAELNTKVEAAKHKAEAAKQEDAYLPIRKETERIVHLLERRDEEEVVKALARKPILPPERERLRQAAIAKGTWYLAFVAQQFLPPLSTKKHLEGYRLREAAKRRAEEKENS